MLRNEQINMVRVKGIKNQESGQKNKDRGKVNGKL